MADLFNIKFTDNPDEISTPMGGWESVAGPKPTTPKPEAPAAAPAATATAVAEPQGTEASAASPTPAASSPGISLDDIRSAASSRGQNRSLESAGNVRNAAFTVLEPGAGTGPRTNLDFLMDVTVPISVELGQSTMKIEDILQLSNGSIVELDRLVDEPIDLKINGRLMARGEIVVVDDSFGIRISEIVNQPVINS
ncbi:MAG: flagellar motor switch protein FliN [Planctomycetota bacterium]